jgi:glutamate racemase
MSIGVFDSGVGGLTVHRALVQRLPQADFTYLADQANAPYGVRTGEEIVDLTRAGCERLFDAGASLVVLACNTASAIALRRLQQTWLPGYRKQLGRPINVLGIIVPTIEAPPACPGSTRPSGAATRSSSWTCWACSRPRPPLARASMRSRSTSAKQDLAVFSQACPDLVPMIEADAGVVDLAKAVEAHVQALKTRIGRYPDRVVLGCTHYEIIADIFRAALPAGTPLIQQPASTADALELYLQRHPELDPGTGGAAPS